MTIGPAAMARRQLVLVREAKLASLLAGAAGDRLEASGVLALDGRCYVIFDDAPDIARVEATLSPGPGVRTRPSPLGPGGHDPVAGHAGLRGLQQPGRGRRPPGRGLPGLLGAVGGPHPPVELGGGRPGDRLGVPHGPGGRAVYCNVEGVSWLSADTVVVVSDRTKRNGQDERCRAKDRSIHVFTLPAGG